MQNLNKHSKSSLSWDSLVFKKDDYEDMLNGIMEKSVLDYVTIICFPGPNGLMEWSLFLQAHDDCASDKMYWVKPDAKSSSAYSLDNNAAEIHVLYYKKQARSTNNKRKGRMFMSASDHPSIVVSVRVFAFLFFF